MMGVEKYRCGNPACKNWGRHVITTGPGDHCRLCKGQLQKAWVQDDRLELEVPEHADFNVEDADVGQTIEVVPAPKDPYDDWYRLQAEIDLHLVKAMNIATELGALITYDKLSVIHRELLAFAAEKKGMSNG